MINGSLRRALGATAFAMMALDIVSPVYANDLSEPPVDLPGAPRGGRNAKTGKTRAAQLPAAKAAFAKTLPAQRIVMRTVKTMRVDPMPVAAGSVVTKPAPETAVKEREATAAPLVASSMSEQDVKSFCGNVGRAASDARVAWQAAKLVELEAALKQRMNEYEARVAEAKEWITKREDAMRRADDVVIAIYAKMRPDAAASQIAALDDALASAVLTKLNARTASAILNEIPAERAARLTDAIAGRRTGADRKPS